MTPSRPPRLRRAGLRGSNAGGELRVNWAETPSVTTATPHADTTCRHHGAAEAGASRSPLVQHQHLDRRLLLVREAGAREQRLEPGLRSRAAGGTVEAVVEDHAVIVVGRERGVA